MTCLFRVLFRVQQRYGVAMGEMILIYLLIKARYMSKAAAALMILSLRCRPQVRVQRFSWTVRMQGMPIPLILPVMGLPLFMFMIVVQRTMVQTCSPSMVPVVMISSFCVQVKRASWALSRCSIQTKSIMSGSITTTA